MSNNFLNENLIQERRKDALDVIGPQVDEAIKKRGDLAERLAALKAQIAGLEADKRETAGQLAALAEERTKTALAGGSPLKTAKRRRDLETKLEDIENALIDLGIAAEQTLGVGQAAHDDLIDLWVSCQAQYRDACQADFAQKVKDLSEEHVAFYQGSMQAYRDIVLPDDFSCFITRLPRGLGQPCVTLYLGSNSLYQLWERANLGVVGLGANIRR